MARESVIVEPIRHENEITPSDWPPGGLLQETLQKKRARLEPSQQNELYWQLAARWALLRAYNIIDSDESVASYKSGGDGHSQLCFSDAGRDVIQTKWESVCRGEGTSDDLTELLTTLKSNNRTLQWSFMDCEPGCQFNLHAHPNIELVYCCRGELHEIRMEGEPVPRTFQRASNGSDILVGPNLTKSMRSWYFGTLSQGKWLVNEVGSVHKSFTSSSGRGCTLLVLWGGSHANVPDEYHPLVDVQSAVDEMDNRLEGCLDCTNWESISETFLPASERRAV